MSAAYMGAQVAYCGHDGWFVADIFKIGNVNVVVANGPISTDTPPRRRGKKDTMVYLNRPADGATHHLSDFPVGGCWKPGRGFFVVPENQVKELSV